MKYNFDPMQETQEEYLRRIHLEDKLKMEWNNNDQKEKANVAADDVRRPDDCRGYSKP
jgi:hypothetical protein